MITIIPFFVFRHIYVSGPELVLLSTILKINFYCWIKATVLKSVPDFNKIIKLTPIWCCCLLNTANWGGKRKKNCKREDSVSPVNRAGHNLWIIKWKLLTQRIIRESSYRLSEFGSTAFSCCHKLECEATLHAVPILFLVTWVDHGCLQIDRSLHHKAKIVFQLHLSHKTGSFLTMFKSLW